MKILNFGSLNIDHTYYLDGFPKPGETISCMNYEKNCGGKGLNQSIALKRAGAEVIHIGKVGKDGDVLLNILREENIDTSFVEISEEDPTGHAIITIDEKGENTIVIYAGANHKIEESQIDKAFEKAEEGDLVLIQNEINNISYIAKKAHELNLGLIFNPAPSNNLNEFPFELVDVLILNEIEGKQLTGEENSNKIVEILSEKYPNIKTVLTLGEEGSIYKSKEEKLFFSTFWVNAVDTTAAGDTFIGYFLANIMADKKIHECFKKASLAAAVSVTRKGALKSIPTNEELEGIKLRYR